MVRSADWSSKRARPLRRREYLRSARGLLCPAAMPVPQRRVSSRCPPLSRGADLNWWCRRCLTQRKHRPAVWRCAASSDRERFSSQRPAGILPRLRNGRPKTKQDRRPRSPPVACPKSSCTLRRGAMMILDDREPRDRRRFRGPAVPAADLRTREHGTDSAFFRDGSAELRTKPTAIGHSWRLPMREQAPRCTRHTGMFDGDRSREARVPPWSPEEPKSPSPSSRLSW